VDAIGWTPFFLVSTAASIPGLILLQRFVPIGSREPVLQEEAAIERRPVSRGRLALTSLVAGLTGVALAAFSSALLAALKEVRGKPWASLHLAGALGRLFSPSVTSDWIRLAGLAVVGLLCAGAAAAFLAARHGLARRGLEKTPPAP
jgi:PAT family beta-lactamase induction signal transducer AmpG